MRYTRIITALFVGSMLASTTYVQAADGHRCRVMDPTGTLLNARTAPYGTVLGTLQNGMLVSIIDASNDQQGRSWVYIASYDTRQAIGWVFREYIACF
jgi:hypothetical protein